MSEEPTVINKPKLPGKLEKFNIPASSIKKEVFAGILNKFVIL